MNYVDGRRFVDGKPTRYMAQDSLVYPMVQGASEAVGVLLFETPLILSRERELRPPKVPVDGVYNIELADRLGYPNPAPDVSTIDLTQETVDADPTDEVQKRLFP